MKHQIMTVMLDAFLIINALLPPAKFLQKRFPPTFPMVHLLHRLYGVDAPDVIGYSNSTVNTDQL